MTAHPIGHVVATHGALVEAFLPFARVGDGVRIGAALTGRVAAVHDRRATIAVFGATDGVAGGDAVAIDPPVLALPLGTPLLGRAIDAAGAPLDGGPAPRGAPRRAQIASLAIAQRRACATISWTGVRAIDGPLAFARGARIGVVGEAGTGKSSLLDAVAAGTDADAIVVALIGERGREAERRVARRDARTTVVCATSERGAAERLRAAEVAFAHAGALRARGLDVLLVVDSLARICGAAREVALAAGEPAGRGGWPPSVFAVQARLLELAGPLGEGSLTLVATVLADGGEAADPVAEHARAALDGHLVLSARLAQTGRFPAVDLPASLSRTLTEAASPAHVAAAAALRAAVAALDESREARGLGLEVVDPAVLRAVAAEAEIEAFLRQGTEPSAPAETLRRLTRLADRLL